MEAEKAPESVKQFHATIGRGTLRLAKSLLAVCIIIGENQIAHTKERRRNIYWQITE